jgi:hypothetical protein
MLTCLILGTVLVNVVLAWGAPAAAWQIAALTDLRTGQSKVP